MMPPPSRHAIAVSATWLLAVVMAAAGCSTYVGTTAKSFLNHVRTDPDPNARYLAYSKLGSTDAYDTEEQKSEAVDTLIEKFERGNEPVASRAMICRTLGELARPEVARPARQGRQQLRRP